MSQSPNYEKIIKSLERKIKSEKNKHHKKITNLVESYIQKTTNTRKNGRRSPVLVNVNEERNLKGVYPRKRRPDTEKKSEIIRKTFNDPQEFHARRPGVHYTRRMVYINSAHPNPHVKLRFNLQKEK